MGTIVSLRPPPADYNYPFGNPDLLVPTHQSRSDRQPRKPEENKLQRIQSLGDAPHHRSQPVPLESRAEGSALAPATRPTSQPDPRPAVQKLVPQTAPDPFNAVFTTDTDPYASPASSVPINTESRAANSAEGHPPAPSHEQDNSLLWDGVEADVADEDPDDDLPLNLPQRTRADTAVSGSAEAIQAAVRRVTDEVHILGNDDAAVFLAHCLASGTAYPPVRLLVHNKELLSRWEEEGGCLTLLRDGRHLSRDHAILEPTTWSDEPITHLIVTLPGSLSVGALAMLKHRIDHQTTICLIQEGLGVIEDLNKLVFTNQVNRPSYVLGHMTHRLDFVANRRFAVAEREQGILCLTAYFRDVQRNQALRFVPPVEKHIKEAKLIRRLTTSPGACAGGYTVAQFLHKRLPEMVYLSLAETVSTMLDIPLNKLWPNRYARHLMTLLLDEITQISLALPEVKKEPILVQAIQNGLLRRELMRMRKEGVQNTMASRVQNSKNSEIRYFNGWFVRRAKQVGIPCPANKMASIMVRAKRRANTGDQHIPLRLARGPYQTV